MTPEEFLAHYAEFEIKVKENPNEVPFVNIEKMIRLAYEYYQDHKDILNLMPAPDTLLNLTTLLYITKYNLSSNLTTEMSKVYLVLTLTYIHAQAEIAKKTLEQQIKTTIDPIEKPTFYITKTLTSG